MHCCHMLYHGNESNAAATAVRRRICGCSILRGELGNQFHESSTHDTKNHTKSADSHD